MLEGNLKNWSYVVYKVYIGPLIPKNFVCVCHTLAVLLIGDPEMRSVCFAVWLGGVVGRELGQKLQCIGQVLL